ncbi:hypothetical protein E2C01_047710 [Portunus trituberculatus]|uniref:Uncharacterized protein n=1 Tax=Portunus trituberculatus TaxID=210409 RepID=A0A5B7G882_PORTR|nr:hypothetical protein [Portunus trituberculatus]
MTLSFPGLVLSKASVLGLSGGDLRVKTAFVQLISIVCFSLILGGEPKLSHPNYLSTVRHPVPRTLKGGGEGRNEVDAFLLFFPLVNSDSFIKKASDPRCLPSVASTLVRKDITPENHMSTALLYWIKPEFEKKFDITEQLSAPVKQNPSIVTSVERQHPGRAMQPGDTHSSSPQHGHSCRESCHSLLAVKTMAMQ